MSSRLKNPVLLKFRRPARIPAMKSLLLALGMSFVGLLPFAAGDSPSKSNIVKPGMDFAEATKVLSVAGLTGEERHYSVIMPEGIATRYFPLDSNTALAITFTEPSKQITNVSLMTSPSYRPVKGLEVYLPLLEIAVEADGSYRAHFALPKRK